MSRCQGRLCETKLYGKSQNSFFFYLGMTPNQHITQLIASCQGCLLRGIVNLSGAVCSVGWICQTDLINSFSNNFSLIPHETKITFNKQCWPFRISLWEHFLRRLKFQTISSPYKKCVTKKLTSLKCVSNGTGQ